MKVEETVDPFSPTIVPFLLSSALAGQRTFSWQEGRETTHTHTHTHTHSPIHTTLPQNTKILNSVKGGLLDKTIRALGKHLTHLRYAQL